ncbi:hypothetical protein RhiirA5_279853 [Rhizophagus irregularis]|uniref:Uncharacterized protein n=1 Tax=Rhizophagus irregularis TaxID=588596 RepID=A0A2N0NLD0_9GLOM|nr:hypothetical protein RhiirA5_279853 [Rhizophagus irregularis]
MQNLYQQPNVPRMLPDTDVRLPSFALPCGIAGPPPKAASLNAKTKIKKPPDHQMLSSYIVELNNLVS